MDHQTVRVLQDELRRELIPLATVPIAVMGFVLVLLTPDDPPPSAFALGLMLLVLAIAAFWLHGRCPDGAAWVLVVGSLLIAFVAWLWRISSGAEYTLVVPLILAAMALGPGATCCPRRGAARRSGSGMTRNAGLGAA
jgi:hypothetical protein